MRTIKSRLSRRNHTRRGPSAPTIVIPGAPPAPPSEQEERASPTQVQHIPWWKREFSDQDEIAIALGIVAFFAIMIPAILGLMAMFATTPK